MRLVSTWLLVLALFAPAGAQAQSGSSAVETTVKKLLQEWDAARNKGDWKAFGQFYTPDATALSSDGTWRSSRQEIEKITAEQWTGTYKGAMYRTTVESVHPLATNVILADTTFEISNIPGGGTRQGRTALILLKADGGWRIAATRNMVPVPAGATRTSG